MLEIMIVETLVKEFIKYKKWVYSDDLQQFKEWVEENYK